MTSALHLVPAAPVQVALALGGNVGDRLAFLQRGLLALASHPDLTLTAVSRIWETAYVGPGPQQDPYLNLVCRGTTRLSPRRLLDLGKAIEARLGRGAEGHLRPRTLDVDLILYGNVIGEDERLTLPHPRARERAFVLAPLAEVIPDAVFPDSGETAAAAWARLQDDDGPWLSPWPEPVVAVDLQCRDEEAWLAALAVHCR